MIDLEEVFEKFEGEFLEFDRVENKLHERPDIHAFILLHSLAPGKHRMVDWAEHDEIGLETNCDKLAAVATEEQIRDLHRCGVRYDDGHLVMFV